MDPACARALRGRARPGPPGLGRAPERPARDRSRTRSRRGAMKVLLLHAFPFDERMWEPQLAALAQHDVLAPHLYGLGSSMDEWAASVAELVGGSQSNTVLQGDGVVVVGASMGGYSAQRLLAHAHVRALMLVGSRAEADPPERLPARDETIRLIREEGVA